MTSGQLPPDNYQQIVESFPEKVIKYITPLKSMSISDPNKYFYRIACYLIAHYLYFFTWVANNEQQRYSDTGKTN